MIDSTPLPNIGIMGLFALNSVLHLANCSWPLLQVSLLVATIIAVLLEQEFTLGVLLTRFTVGGTHGVSSNSSPKPSSTTSATADIIGLFTEMNKPKSGVLETTNYFKRVRKAAIIQ